MNNIIPINGEIPKDFPAGWQWVERGDIEYGDIIRYPDGTKEFVRAFIGFSISGLEEGCYIYRKVPVPKQGGPYTTSDDMIYNEPAEKAKTYDEGKAPLAYIPWAAVDGMAHVQAYGHKKYKDWNNYRKGMEVGRNLSCAIRHIRDFMNGMDVDPESKRSPLEHAMCRVAFVLQNLADGTAIDDRYKKP